MTVEIVHCPNCASKEVSRNGKTRHGKQNFKCRECGSQFVKNPEGQPITEEQKELMSRMLLERISQAGIARVLKVSEDTVQRYVNSQAAAVKKQVEVTGKEKKRLNVQMDELWSFVDSKGNQQWVWLALDAETREIVGVHIGDRSAVSPRSFMGFNTTSVPSMCSNLYRSRFVLMILYCPVNVIKVSIKIVV